MTARAHTAKRPRTSEYAKEGRPWRTWLPWRLGGTCAAVLALSAAALVPHAAGEEGGRPKAPRILRVEIKGSITLTPEALRHGLATRAGGAYDRAILDNDLHRLVRTGRYRSVKWGKPRREADGVVLTLTVEERPIVKEIEYVALSGADLKWLMETAEKDERTRSGIERELREILGGRPEGSGRPPDGPARRLALVRYYLSISRAERPRVVPLAALKKEAGRAGLFAGARERYDEALAFRLARRIEDLCREKSFFGAKVDYFTTPLEGHTAQGLSQVKLVFAIEEGRKAPVRGCRFVGNRLYTDRKLWGVMKKLLERVGGAKGFDRLRFERVLRVIQQEMYRNEGYLDAGLELKYVELFTFDPPEGEVRQWLVARVEIDEGQLYTVGTITLTVAPPEAPEGTDEPLEVTREDMMSAVTDPAEEHRNEAPLKEGGVFSERSVALAARRIGSLLGHHGRINSAVRRRQTPPEEGTTIPVEFVVKPSRRYRVGGIAVRGNHKTKPQVFARELVQAGVKWGRMDKGTGKGIPGDVIDTRKLKLAERNIKFTGLVKPKVDEVTGELIGPAVRIRPFPRDDGTADLAIDVNEGETGMLQMGVSLSSDNEVAGMIEFSQRNFNLFGFPRSATNWTNAFSGAGQTLRLSASFGTVSKFFDARFEEPYFLGLPVKLGVGYFDKQRSYTDYKDGRTGVRASLSRSWSLHKYKRQRLALTALLRDERIEIDTEEPLFVAEAGTSRLRRFGMGISFDSRDSWLLPSQGWYTKLFHNVIGGPFGGDKDFNTTEFDLQRHIRLGASLADQPFVLQFRMRASYAEPRGEEPGIPFYERYYAGGFGTLRGFDYRSVGPKDPPLTGMAIGGEFRVLETVEYSFPLSPDGTLRGAFYYDAGNVWEKRSDFDFSDQKQSAGMGILIQPPGWPVPISIYLGWILNEQPEDDGQRVSFMFGTMFF